MASSRALSRGRSADRSVLAINLSVEGLLGAKRALSSRRTNDFKKVVKKRAYAIVSKARGKLRAKWPKFTGNLKRATKAKTTRGGGAVLYTDRSGASSGKGHHVHIVDKGTQKRATRKGKNRGKMPALDAVAGIRRDVDREVNDVLIPEVQKAIATGFRKDMLG